MEEDLLTWPAFELNWPDFDLNWIEYEFDWPEYEMTWPDDFDWSTFGPDIHLESFPADLPQ